MDSKLLNLWLVVVPIGLLLFILTFRMSLFVLGLPVVMAATALTKKTSNWWKPALASVAVYSILAAIPIDLWFQKTGHLGHKYVPMSWGLPSQSGNADANAGKVVRGGCMSTLYPTRSLLVITF